MYTVAIQICIWMKLWLEELIKRENQILKRQPVPQDNYQNHQAQSLIRNASERIWKQRSFCRTKPRFTYISVTYNCEGTQKYLTWADFFFS